MLKPTAHNFNKNISLKSNNTELNLFRARTMYFIRLVQQLAYVAIGPILEVFNTPRIFCCFQLKYRHRLI